MIYSASRSQSPPIACRCQCYRLLLRLFRDPSPRLSFIFRSEAYRTTSILSLILELFAGLVALGLSRPIKARGSVQRRRPRVKCSKLPTNAIDSMLLWTGVIFFALVLYISRHKESSVPSTRLVNSSTQHVFRAATLGSGGAAHTHCLLRSAWLWSV